MTDSKGPVFPASASKARLVRRLHAARDTLPGERNDLPEGALGGVPVDPQGDENRDPPTTAPAPPS